MAWRNPQYSFLHAARTAGVSALSSNNTIAAAFPLDNLIDDRAGSLTKADASAADHYLQLDRGAGGLEELAHLFIPAGHNLNGIDIRVQTATDAAMTVPTAILATVDPATTGLIDLAMTGGTEAQRRRRYVRLDFPNDNFTFELPQLVYSRERTTTRGPNPLPGWSDRLVDNTLLFPKSSGVVAALELGADRRRIEYEYRFLETADELVFSDLWTECATARPFFLDPAYDDEAAIWVRLVEPIDRRLDTIAPKSDARAYRRRLIMLEHLA